MNCVILDAETILSGREFHIGTMRDEKKYFRVSFFATGTMSLKGWPRVGALEKVKKSVNERADYKQIKLRWFERKKMQEQFHFIYYFIKNQNKTSVRFWIISKEHSKQKQFPNDITVITHRKVFLVFPGSRVCICKIV